MSEEGSRKAEMPQCNAKEAEEEEGGEDELVDEQEKCRGECKKTNSCMKYFEDLNSCNDRVNSKKKTAETCLEEMIDYVHCVDHCAAKGYFKKLK